jgi:predicted enzyme related to lactoylglutathione lyase
MSDKQGTFVWYELLTEDPKKAIAFYGNVIGWGTQPFGETYNMWTAGKTPIGGVMGIDDAQMRAGTKPHWWAHVLADDVDALTKKAVSLGAKVVLQPTDIPTVGRFSIVDDPQGAEIALFTPLDASMSRPETPSDGFMSWHELMTDDQEAAFRFYSQLFGWQKTDAVQSPMGVYQMYGKNGQTYGGIGGRPKDYPYGPHWLYYTKVADLDAALERVKKGGGQVLHGPMEVPGGSRVAQCKDPQGALFALHGA